MLDGSQVDRYERPRVPPSQCSTSGVEAPSPTTQALEAVGADTAFKLAPSLKIRGEPDTLSPPVQALHGGLAVGVVDAAALREGAMQATTVSIRVKAMMMRWPPQLRCALNARRVACDSILPPPIRGRRTVPTVSFSTISATRLTQKVPWLCVPLSREVCPFRLLLE